MQLIAFYRTCAGRLPGQLHNIQHLHLYTACVWCPHISCYKWCIHHAFWYIDDLSKRYIHDILKCMIYSVCIIWLGCLYTVYKRLDLPCSPITQGMCLCSISLYVHTTAAGHTGLILVLAISCRNHAAGKEQLRYRRDPRDRPAAVPGMPSASQLSVPSHSQQQATGTNLCAPSCVTYKLTIGLNAMFAPKLDQVK